MARWIATLIAAVVLMCSGAMAQQKGKQHILKGKVTDVGTDRLTVNHEKVEGYMDAMTMPYKVDKVDILKAIKAGDQIEATVYDNDYTLYNVKVVPPAAAKGKK